MRTSALLAPMLIALCCRPVIAEGANVCSQTSRAARHACDNEARDAYWTAIGICANSVDPAGREPCRHTAKREGRDAAKSCGEQFHAREDLCNAIGQAAYAPTIDPGRFLSPAATAARPNPFFPLVPGTRWVYASGPETTTVTITAETRRILGVLCIVVRDVVSADGGLIEDTDDYFAQDVDGNVWYFGELSKGFENGELASLEGSWRAGVDGALPGIIMKATPAVGDTYRQEFAFGDAEDAAEVLSLTGSATTPGASCAGTCIVTRDFTPIEPDAAEQKYYATGVGLILELGVETGERVELTSFTRG